MPTKKEINVILRRGWTNVGIMAWWDRPRCELDGKTPNEVWATDPDKVYDLVMRGREMGGT